ncbi:uncharacterized protein LOC113743982 isoform X2 [Larimichthys crocea]|uniref:uncharacterized protein LOC113743982 isoform X2 n=1 Tax=Larimichthys crocea TaxID=215358 RepID=UPI000F5F0676|nr:uncharacterized protein LOC113743982 isoform X2 [Larimichthys crocea]
MIPMKHQKTLGLMPWDPFVTTYSSDYKPFNERHPEVIRWEPRTEAKAAPAFINPPQTDRETWPIFRRYFYKTANDAYGSQCCSHVNTHSHIPPCCSPFPAFLPTFATSISETGVFGSTRTKEAGVARGIGPLLGEEKGQLHYVFGGKTNVLEQQEAKDKIDILYEEGVIVMASHVGPACCKDILRSVCREAGLLHFPVASSSLITVNDADSWGNSAFQSGLRPAFGLKTSNYLQPPSSSQCSCCAWKPECPNSYCFKMQTSPPGIPLGSTQSLSHVQPAGYRAEPCRTPWQTEYQASYAAGWAQP